MCVFIFTAQYLLCCFATFLQACCTVIISYMDRRSALTMSINVHLEKWPSGSHLYLHIVCILILSFLAYLLYCDFDCSSIYIHMSVFLSNWSTFCRSSQCVQYWHSHVLTILRKHYMKYEEIKYEIKFDLGPNIKVKDDTNIVKWSVAVFQQS